VVVYISKVNLRFFSTWFWVSCVVVVNNMSDWSVPSAQGNESKHLLLWGSLHWHTIGLCCLMFVCRFFLCRTTMNG